MKKNWKSYLLNLIAIALVYFVVYLLIENDVINNYYIGILILICINIILATSLNLTTGFLGQLTLGHAGFMSIGAYAASLFSIHMELPAAIEFPLSLVVGGVVAAVFGVIIGVPALRLRGDYLAIITLGFGEIIRVIILNLDFTGGARGLAGIPYATNFTNVFIVMVIAIFVLRTLIKSRHGRAIISIREDEIAAEAAGVPTTYYKLLAFIVAALFAGVAGGLYAHHITILDASKFDFNRSVELVVIVVLGGMGSLTGSVIAAIILTILPEVLRGFAEYRMLIYSVVLIAFMIFKPSGLLGYHEFSFQKIFALFKRKPKE